MEVVRFVVDETPYACWDWNLKEKNLDFINGIDASYYKYVAEINADNVSNEEKHNAALSLRLAYSQGLETLFSLICSAIQAPLCSVGWLLAYKNQDLESLVRKICSRKKIYSRFREKNINLENIAKYVNSYSNFEPSKIKWIQDGFGVLWRKFATDFLDPSFINEYNSAKHGLRTKSGGFTIAIGEEAFPGAPVPPEKMECLGASEFGTSYYIFEKIIDDKRLNFRPRFQARNWQTENLREWLLLIYMSINNVLGFLKILNGVAPDKCAFLYPDTKEVFELPWKRTVGVSVYNFDTVIAVPDINPETKESILKSYNDNI